MAAFSVRPQSADTAALAARAGRDAAAADGRVRLLGSDTALPSSDAAHPSSDGPAAVRPADHRAPRRGPADIW